MTPLYRSSPPAPPSTTQTLIPLAKYASAGRLPAAILPLGGEHGRWRHPRHLRLHHLRGAAYQAHSVRRPADGACDAIQHHELTGCVRISLLSTAKTMLNSLVIREKTQRLEVI